jgi:tRNA G10  N-methylase Trm11
MSLNRYIYNVNHQLLEKDLCALEMKALFDITLEGKVFISNILYDPTISPFLKNRLDIMHKATTFEGILDYIESEQLAAKDFKVKYVQLDLDDPHYKKRRDLCNQLVLKITGFPSFSDPKITFGITWYQGEWYFGKLEGYNPTWKDHISKPHSYSSSLGINLAKVLMNIAGEGDFSRKIIDPCCGVGTVLLEGLYAGYDIRGWEINEKIAEDARENLRYFKYEPLVTTGDICTITDHYDVSIIDLPYGNFSLTDVSERLNIIKNANRISDKMVVVSSDDIRDILIEEKLTLTDQCQISKSEKWKFTRYVWVCE